MKFIFFIQALDGKELQAKTKMALDNFFPTDEWNFAVCEVSQTQQTIVANDENKGKKKSEPIKILFQVTVEVSPKGLNNALVNVRNYTR